MPRLPRVAALLAVLACAAPVFAQEGAPVPGPAAPGSASGATTIPDPWTAFGGQQGFGMGVGIEKLGGDFWASTVLNTDFSIGKIGIGLQLPLTFLVYNDEGSGCAGASASPPVKCTREDKAFGGIIRRPAWNEPGDFLKLIRYVRYGHKRDEYYALVGQHWSSSIGHGTLVGRYNNALNLDVNKVGVAFDVNKTFFGFELFTNDVMNPQVLAGRVHVKPLGATPFLSGWAVGVTVASDIQAPFTFLHTTSTPAAIAMDDKGRPVVGDERVQTNFGFDTEFAVLDNSLIRLVPYIDWNRIMGGGNGWHLGVMSDIHLPVPVIDVSLFAKLEYRILGAGYIPEYFDQQYELGRFNFNFTRKDGTSGVAPKAFAAREMLATGNTVQGWYGEVAGNIGGFVTVGGTLQDYADQPGGSIGLYATIPNFSLIKAMAYYLRKNFKGLGEAFKIDERSMLGATLAVKAFGPLYLTADFRREWRLAVDGSSFEAVDAYSFGAMSLFKF